MGWLDLGTHDLVDGAKPKRVSNDGELMMLVQADGRLFALDARCPHQGAPLDKGVVKISGSQKTVTCPAHGSMFDLETGRVMRPPATKPVQVYDVKVEDGRVHVRLRPAT